MYPQFPGVPEGPEHLGLAREVFVLPVLHIPPVHEGLEVRAVLDPIRRVDIDHLHLPGHPLLLQQGVHDEQGVAGDEAVAPVVLVAVELHRLPERGVLDRELKERGLPVIAVAALCRPDDCPRVDPFVDVEGDRWDIKGGALGLPRPLELRVEVRVVRVGLCAVIGFGRRADQSRRRVIQPAGPLMVVLLDILLVGFLLSPGHRIACVILFLQKLNVVKCSCACNSFFVEKCDSEISIFILLRVEKSMVRDQEHFVRSLLKILYALIKE